MSTAQAIRDGINIILAAEPDAQFDAQHDQVYCGKAPGLQPEEAKQRLAGLGWFIAEDSWSHFT